MCCYTIIPRANLKQPGCNCNVVPKSYQRNPLSYIPKYYMPYQFTFPASATLNGANAAHKIYKMSLIPTAPAANKQASLYYSHFRSALSVRLLDVQGTVFCPRAATDTPASIACAAVVADTNTAATVHALARGKEVASEGRPGRFSLAEAIGVRRVLKGVADLGGVPAIHIAVSSSYDASDTDSVVLSALITVEFDGESDDVAYEVALTAA
jgi:hypothetical protein